MQYSMYDITQRRAKSLLLRIVLSYYLRPVTELVSTMDYHGLLLLVVPVAVLASTVELLPVVPVTELASTADYPELLPVVHLRAQASLLYCEINRQAILFLLVKNRARGI